MVQLAIDFLMIFDCLTLIIGAALLGFAIYVVIAYASFAQLVSTTTLYITMGVGGALIIVGCLGCVASSQASRGHKVILACYLLIVIAALAGQIASCILVANFIASFSGQSFLATNTLTATTEIVLNNAMLSTFTACCIGCAQPEGCNNAFAFYNQSLPNCFNTSCTAVPFCGANPLETGCFKANPGTNIYPPATFPNAYAPALVDQGICTLMASAKNASGIALVGPASSGSCGGGSPTQFLLDQVAFWSQSFNYVLIGFGVLAGLQALNMLVCCYVFFVYKDGKN